MMSVTGLEDHLPDTSELRTPESLVWYVSPDDHELTRKEFLFTVATRILDDLGIPHELESIDPNTYPKVS